jgi:hypothetical protein
MRNLLGLNFSYHTWLSVISSVSEYDYRMAIVRIVLRLRLMKVADYSCINRSARVQEILILNSSGSLFIALKRDVLELLTHTRATSYTFARRACSSSIQAPAPKQGSASMPYGGTSHQYNVFLGGF